MALGWLLNLLHLRASQRWSRQRVLASQLKFIQDLVATARRDIPLYQELYARSQASSGDIRSFEDFHRLPFVTRELLKANFPDRIVSRQVDFRQLYPIATSGTTDRVMLFHDEYKRDWDRAADWLVELEGNGFRPGQRQVRIPPDACYERCGADEYGRTRTIRQRLEEVVAAEPDRRSHAVRQLRAQVVRDAVRRLTVLKALGVDGTATSPDILEDCLRQIRSLRPRVLSGLPMFLHILARHVQQGSRRPDSKEPARRPQRLLAPIVRPAGGKLTSRMIEDIEETLGPVRENFGTAELGTIAHDCEYSTRQHLFSELFHLEFVRGGRHVGPGELGEIVVTDLRNRVCPLIRYRLGDMGRYDVDRCPCGRTGQVFTVCGRLSEVIVTPDGRAFSGDEVLDFFLARRGVSHARVVQERPERFLVEMVIEDSAPRPSTEALSASFSRFLGMRVTVRPRVVKAITPARSGKYTYVVSHSFEQFHELREMHAVRDRQTA